MNKTHGIVVIAILFAITACKKTANNTTSTPAAIHNGSEAAYVISTEGLTLREKPSTSARAITTLPRSAKLTVISKDGAAMYFAGIEGAWWHVAYDAESKQGYVFSGLLAPNISAESIDIKKALNAGSDIANQELVKILEKGQGQLIFDVEGKISGDWGIHQGRVELVLLTPSAGKGKIQPGDEVTFAAMTNEPVAIFKPTSWSVFGFRKNQILLEGPMTKIFTCHSDACKDTTTKVNGALLLTIDSTSAEKIQVKNIKVTGY